MARIVITPNAPNMPADWRTPWQQFAALKEIGRKLKEPVSSWRLEAPKGFGKMLDRRWSLVYTFRSQRYETYIGINGKQAAEGIREVIKGFRAVLAGHKAYEESKPKTVAKKAPIPPIYNPGLVQKMIDEWNLAIKGIRDRDGAIAFNRDHRYMNWFMRQQAGFLEMSMRQYLFSHPHATYWPTPPRNQTEFDSRQRRLQQIVEDRERNSHRNEEW